MSDRAWLALHLGLALIGTVEWFSASVARAMAKLQQSLLDIVAGAPGGEIAARIAPAGGGQNGFRVGTSLVVAILLAVATYSGVEILRPKTVMGWSDAAGECFVCAAVCLAFGIAAARWIVAMVPNPAGTLFTNVLGFLIQGGLGMGLVLAVAAIAGVLSFEPLGFARWLIAIVLLLSVAAWPFAFFARSLFDLAPKPVDTRFWAELQRWSGRVLLMAGLPGVGLLVYGLLTETSVSWVDQVMLAGVLLPLFAAVLMLLGAALALLLGTLFVTSAQSAQHVLRVLVQKKVNLGYTLLGIELFFKEVLTLL